MLKGAFSAIITPMTADGQVDYEGLKKHIEFQIQNGINGIVPCGTTGESATLSHDEHKQVVKTVVEQVNGRVPVIAGAGSNSTKETIALTQFAKDIGADAALVITPYYNKPTPAGLIAHYKATAEVGIPIVIYNVPGRTGINIQPAVVAELAREKNIVALKDAANNLAQTSETIRLINDDSFTVLSGEDGMLYPMMSLGVQGVISVSANIIPGDMAALCKAALDGDYVKARALHYKLAPLCAAMFYETNPIPIKKALELLGHGSAYWRLPLVAPKPETVQKLTAALQAYGLNVS